MESKGKGSARPFRAKRLVASPGKPFYSLPPVKRNFWQSLTLAGLLATSSAACGGSHTLHQGWYRGRETSYRLHPPPASWRTVEVKEGGDLAWTDGQGALVQTHSSCSPELDLPLEALSHHLVIGFTEVEVIEQRRVPMDGREALRTHLRAKLDGVPRELLLVVLKKNECVYDFALVAPEGAPFAQGRREFEGVLEGFHTRGKR